MVCPQQTKIVPGAQSRSNTKLVEGACRKGCPARKPPLRQACGLPPPRAGEDQINRPTNVTSTMAKPATLE